MVVRVLFVTNGYPTVRHPEFCIFNKEQIDSIRETGIDGDLLFINAHEHGWREYLKAIPEIRRRSTGADLVHCFHGLTFLTATLACPRTPMVVSFLNAIDNEFRELPSPVASALSVLTRWLLRNGNNGKIFKDRVPEFLRGDPLARNIPNGVDTNFFVPMDREEAIAALELDPDDRYILFVSSKSRHRKQKRYDRFLEVLSGLRKSSEFSNLEKLVIENEPRHRIPLFFAAASLHLLTSDFEGSPNSVKESLACGVPVVAADVGNVREMIEGVPGCEVVAPDDVPSYVAAVRRVLSDPRDRAAMAEARRAELRTRGLQQEETARQVVALYDHVLGGEA